MARMQQFDQERFRHLNVELLKVEERARELQRGRDQLLVQLHELRFQVCGDKHLGRRSPHLWFLPLGGVCVLEGITLADAVLSC